GEGPATEPVLCTTDQDVPSPPAGIKAVASGPRSLIVSWLPPSNHHGRLTRYTVYWDTVGSRAGEQSRRIQPNVNHFTLHNLKQTTYEIWVTASTKMGEGHVSEKA
ncbi:unnamed protein product, partial [Meganyctiphanes norvegica]